MPQRVEHDLKPAIENLSQWLRFDVSRVVVVHPECEWNGADTRGVNRIFLVIKEGERRSGIVENDPSPQYYSIGQSGDDWEQGCSPDTMILEPHLACFMPAKVPVRYRFAKNVLMLGFHFRLELFPGVDVFGLGPARFQSRACDAAWAEALFEAVQEEADMGSQIRVIAQVMALASRFIDCGHDALQRILFLRNKYSAVSAYLESGEAAKHSVSGMAEVMGISTTALNRHFHQDLGMSPKTFLDQHTLRLAEQALEQTQKQIKVISHELGFATTSYFCRFVRKHTGSSPQEIREARLFLEP